MNKVFILLLSLVFFSCSDKAPVSIDEASLDPALDNDGFLSEPAMEPDNLIIIAVGDNLYHDVMIRAGEEGDYESAYEEIRDLVQYADIAFINQETLLGGSEFGFSGYPLFNSPQSLGRAISNIGFNVISHANNHAMDKGERAVFATLDFWDTIPEAAVLGIHRSGEERNNPVIMEVNNFRVGFLAYTHSLNGIPLPNDKPYLVSLINREVMAREINALRPLCDILVVSIHWGDEYQHNHNRTQEGLAVFLAEHQVDLVLGHHPHVLQPVEYVPRPDGRYMLCYYSLGNFISAQSRLPTMLGAMAYIKIKKIPAVNEGERDSFMYMDDGVIPLVTHYENNWTGFRVYPLYAYSEELAAMHRLNRNGMEMTMNYLRGISSGVLGFRELKQNPFEQL